jgi:hypothetical protein
MAQVLLMVSFALLFSRIDAQYYRPIARRIRLTESIGEHVVISSISLLTLSSALFYWLRPSRVLYNYLVASYPLVLVVVIWGLFRGVYNDFLHLPTFFISYLIIRLDKEKLDKRYVFGATLFILTWSLVVHSLKLNYFSLKIFPQGLVIGLLLILVNVTYPKLLQGNKKGS